MKSLESLEIINICLEELDYEHKEDTNIWRYDLEVIKEDLEVLEIIRKKEVSIFELKYAFKNRRNDEEVLYFYNWGKDAKLTMEELLKFKQWLEENEE